MNENNNENINENINVAETQPKQAEEKLFTQAELDKIVKQRIARERAKEPAPAVNEAELTARSNRLDCKEYLLDNGLPVDLLDIIDTSNVQVFAEKVSKLQSVSFINSYPVVHDAGEIQHEVNSDAAIKEAFKKKAHKPKKPKEFNY